jgi:MFS family permease
LTWTAYAVGGATGPIVVGYFYDRAGNYQPRMIVALALTCVVGAALSLLLPPYPAESFAESKAAATQSQLASEA